MTSFKFDIKSDNLLFLGFNQNFDCVCCGTTKGYIIYCTDPFIECIRHDFSVDKSTSNDNIGTGIGYIEMLFNTNILALVGGGKNPRYPPNIVMIWDDSQNKSLGKLEFRSQVMSVKLKRDKVVIAIENKIYIYNLSNLKEIDTIQTKPNPKGLCALSADPNSTVLICPALTKGYLKAQFYSIKHKPILLSCHKSFIQCIALSYDGKLLVTSSEKGTLIRIWDVYSNKLLQELRRGSDIATITSICFSQKSNQFLAVASNKGTIHIFKLNNKILSILNKYKYFQQKEDSKNVKLNISSTFTYYLPNYFNSEWSFAQFYVPKFDKIKNKNVIVTFSQDEQFIIVITANGMYYKAFIDIKNGGKCKIKLSKKIF